jgi:hypothetical protein
MFYKQTDIEDKLKCSMCNERLDLAKCLPCMEHVCTICEKSIYTKNDANNKFKCPVYEHSHEKPEIELPVNKLIQLILDCIPVEIDRGDAFRAAKDNLVILKNSMRHLEDKFRNATKLIKNHCDFLRNDVELTTESNIELLNKYKSDMLREIDEYERVCLENVDKKDEDFEKFLSDCEWECADWSNYIQGLQLDEVRTKKIAKDVKAWLVWQRMKMPVWIFQYFAKGKCFSSKMNNLRSCRHTSVPSGI